MVTPRALGYRMPAEWERHSGCWVAWPSHEELWQDALAPVRDSFVSLCRGIADGGESLDVLVLDEASQAVAADELMGLSCYFHKIPFGDIWLRDTAPIFVKGPKGVAAVSFAFNGWGGKYLLEGDSELSERVALASGMPRFRFPFVLEGGAIEVDGLGTCLTTRQCLLNSNRTPGASEADVEEALRETLGVTTVLWLNEGLRNDHTDGHVDTLARFVAPGVVVCMEPAPDDPNAAALEQIRRDLQSFRDASGKRLEVIGIPSPGRVEDPEGRLMPASYVNFYVANATVIVPTYGVLGDDEAVKAIGFLYPGRRTIGVPARQLLEGGGAFHCITQQQPAEEES